MKKRLLQYGICFIISSLISLWVMNNEGLFIAKEPVDIAAILCDAFFVPGIMLTMIGALLWISTTGLFDSIGYAVQVAGHTLLPFLFKSDKKSYYDYKTEKDEKRVRIPSFIFIVGAFFLLLSVIALMVWTSL